jgi:RNA polymerase sigma-70 factor (ECF subfamily)
MKALREKYLLYRIYSRHDAEAYGEIYDLYVNRIYRFVYFKLPSRSEAEDITADVFLRAWEYLKENKVEYLGALLYQIARNAVMDFYRQRARYGITEDETALENLPDGGKLVKAAETAVDMEAVLKALKSLKGEYQEILIMKYLDEMSSKEIANTLKKKPNTVRVLAHRALNSLREAIENQNVK